MSLSDFHFDNINTLKSNDVETNNIKTFRFTLFGPGLKQQISVTGIRKKKMIMG